MDEYINYVKTLRVHGYTPKQINTLLVDQGVDKQKIQSLLDYLETTVPKVSTHAQKTAAESKLAQKSSEHSQTAYLKENFEHVQLQMSKGKSHAEIDQDLTARGVDETTKSILIQLANRRENLSDQKQAANAQVQPETNTETAKTTDENSRISKKLINRLIFLVAIVEPIGVIPQVVAVYGHHNAKGVAISTWFLFVLFDITWLWYAIVEKQKALIVSAGLFMVLEGVVLVGAILYGGAW